jgi:hypothetical protein
MQVLPTSNAFSSRAETAVVDAPILPPAPQAATSQIDSLPGRTTAPPTRIAGRRNRLRLAHRPTARTWRRRAARRVHSLLPLTRSRHRD